jgi:hypothetical protein
VQALLASGVLVTGADGCLGLAPRSDLHHAA